MNKLFHGKEIFLSHREAQKEAGNLAKELKAEESVIDAEKIDPEELSELLNTNSLFAQNRVILLKRPYKSKKRDTLIHILLEYLERNSPDTQIIVFEDQKIKSNTKYYKYFKENNSVYESPDLNKRTFVTWAKEEVKNLGIDLENNLIKVLAERVNYSAESFYNEIQKLKLSGKRVFTEENLVENTTDVLEYDIWKLIDSINSQKEDSEKIEILERILAQEVDANFIISMLERNLRLIVLTKELTEEGKNSNETASILKIPPFTVPQMKGISKKYTSEKISLLFEKLSSLDYEIKRGRIEPNLGLTLLITKF